jgi:hypothetical protein
MSKGFFIDKTSMPTNNDILKIIGSAIINWDFILRYLTSDLKLKGDFKFYGVNYGWAMRFIKSGKSIVALYPDMDCFTVQVILNKSQVDSALLKDLDVEIIETIRDKEAIHEGKWIYLRIDNKTDLKDILKLIDIRIKIK